MVLDPTYPDIDLDNFKRHNWSQFYGNMKEILPSNAPIVHGKEFIIRAFVGVDLAGHSLTGRSRSTFFVMIDGISLC